MRFGRYFVYIMLAVCMQVGMYADEITVKNSGDQDIYVAIYTVPRYKDEATRTAGPKLLKANSQVKIQRKDLGLFDRIRFSRRLYFANNKNALQARLTSGQMKKIASTDVGASKGASFEVGITKARVEGQQVADQDTIIVYNETDQPVHAALYLQPTDKSKSITRLSSTAFAIKAGGQARLNRPNLSFSKWFSNNIKLYFSKSPEQLKDTITYRDSRNLSSVRANYMKGALFYISANKDGFLEGYNAFRWTLKPAQDRGKAVLKKAEKSLKEMLHPAVQSVRNQFLKKEDNPWADQVARVRQSVSLPQEEKMYLNQRTPKVKRQIEKLTGEKISGKAPRIGMVFSGGGFRAMVATAGALQGASQSGVLDAVTYTASLSGSTWTIAPLMTSALSPSEFKDRLLNTAGKGLKGIGENIAKSPQITKLFATDMMKQLAFGQSITLVDFYGFLLGRNLLKNLAEQGGKLANPERLTLADQQSRVKKADMPFPIYTAALDRSGEYTKQIAYEWFEFSPYEAGSTYLKGFVPSWALGRRFNDGTSINNAPPYTLGNLMGIWGSAFAFNFQDAYRLILNGAKPELLRNMFKGLAQFKVGGARAAEKLANYTYKMKQSPFAARKTMKLMDAGIAFNLPTPPLLRRERDVDILVVVDASGDSQVGNALRDAEAYAQEKGIKFPKIDYEKAKTQICSVFEDKNSPDTPTVIYLPMVKNENYKKGFDPRKILSFGYIRTTNFLYKKDQILEFSGLFQKNVEDSKQKIVDAIRNKIK